MIGFNAKALQQEETIVVELKHPETAEAMLNPDKTPCTVTCHAAHTIKFKAALKRIRSSKVNKEDNDLSLEEIDTLLTGDVDVVAESTKHIIVTANLQTPEGKKIPLKEVKGYADNSNMAWLGGQLVAGVLASAGKLKQLEKNA